MHRILAVLLGGAAAFAAGDPPPIAFEPNQGQTHPQVQALARGAGYTLFLSSGDAVLTLKLPAAMRADALMRIRLLGARPAPQARFLEPLPGVSHYLSGNDRGNWRTGIPRYGRVSYHGVYEGIDLVYYGREGRVESDFVVSPGARPGSIRLAVDGARDVRLEGGDLVAETFAGQVRLRQPVVYQEAGESRRQVSGAWELHPGGAIGFAIGPHDARLPLVIDPVLDYSTYLGGNSGESIYGIAVDASGATYIAGETQSADFPAANPFQSARKSARDAFVAKLNPAGSALVYSTYLGGDADDRINAIAVDAVGNAYVAGRTASRNFPTASPLRANYGGGDGDAFAAKLNPSGSALLYSTYLGGASDDGANGIAVDSAGNAYLAGFTQSNDFPTQRPFQATRGAATCRESLLGFTWTWPCSDAFAAKLNPAGSALVFSTFLGGSRGSGNSAGSDTGNAIALDASGNVYLAGETNSSDFPVRGPAQTSLGGGTDAFVAKLSDAGSALALAYSTYLGGSASDYGRGIAVAASGAAVVAGYTTSPNFPTASPHQAVLGGGSDAFLTQLNAAGSGLVYSTYLGGKQDDQANAVAVDAAGNALLTGSTRSDDFPRLNAPQPLRAGSDDAFLVKAGPAGSLVLSTYFGGSGGDVGNAIALRGDAAAYVFG